MHPVHRTFGSMVCDPFKGPLTKGLSGDPSAPDTVVVRRRSIIPLSFGILNGPGAEVALVMNGRRNPYAATWDGSAVEYVSRDATDTGLIPSDAYARVVASAVKILYTGSEQNRGGVWHHFSYDREKSDSPAMAAFKTWGSLLNNLEYAVSDSRMGQDGVIGFVDSPEIGFGRVNAQPDNLLDAGMPAAGTDTSVMRLAFTGSAASCNFELHVVELVEYYHVDHSAFSTGPTVAPHAEEVHQSVQSLLSIKGSQNTRIDGGLAHRVGVAISAASGIAQASTNLLNNGRDALNAGRGALEAVRGFWNNYLAQIGRAHV